MSANSENALSRRAMLTATLGGALSVAAAATGVAGTSDPAQAKNPSSHVQPKAAPRKKVTDSIVEHQRRRVVIIGAGITGTSLAWLLDGECDVTLLEADSYLGGHIHTIDVDGHAVDVGAQFFAKTTHPQYCKLVKQLALPTTNLPLDLTLSQSGNDRPTLMTPHIHRPVNTFRDFANMSDSLGATLKFIHAARAIHRADDRNITVADFIDGLDVKDEYKRTVLYPLAALEFGCRMELVGELSAWAATIFLARAFPLDNWKVAQRPQDLVRPFEFHSIVGGLQAVVGSLIKDFNTHSSTVQGHTNSKVTSVRRVDGKYVVRAAGKVHHADEIVMALPPYAASPLLEMLGADQLAEATANMEYFDTEIAIHTDDALMPRNRYRSAYNVVNGPIASEGTIWFGAFSDAANVHKSWVTHRGDNRPKNILYSRMFKHPMLTPDYFRIGSALGEYHKDGLSFAGGYTVAVVSQEHGLISAMNAAERLAPGSAKLTKLKV